MDLTGPLQIRSVLPAPSFDTYCGEFNNEVYIYIYTWDLERIKFRERKQSQLSIPFVSFHCQIFSRHSYLFFRHLVYRYTYICAYMACLIICLLLMSDFKYEGKV